MAGHQVFTVLCTLALHPFTGGSLHPLYRRDSRNLLCAVDGPLVPKTGQATERTTSPAKHTKYDAVSCALPGVLEPLPEFYNVQILSLQQTPPLHCNCAQIQPAPAPRHAAFSLQLMRGTSKACRTSMISNPAATAIILTTRHSLGLASKPSSCYTIESLHPSKHFAHCCAS
jgi:hypothetical protein